MTSSSPCNILTVDVEDYFQVSGFESVVKRDQWESIPSRVEASTHLLLELFSEADAHGTFFVLGWIADRYPNLIQQIRDAGHEIASHGYWHRLVYSQTPDEFRCDLQESRRAIKAACGVDVTAYRAPSFSITNKSMWALDVLAEEGFHIDSSIFPMRHDRYGVADANPRIHERNTKLHPILEIPPSVWRSRLGAIPVGGGYFRLLPISLTIKAMKEIRNTGSPAMLYLHPWEVDSEQPVVRNVRLKNRIRHRIGLKTCSKKLVHLLRTSNLKSIKQALASTKSDAPTAKA
ncbi:MAG: XrtA system polysaccharide deacetylase [Pirellulales bacterium]